MKLSEASERAMQLRDLFAQYEQQLYGRTWSREELALGFIGDVGDLMKLLQAKEGVRDIPESEDKLMHEFADCLWAILVLAKLYEVDIEAAFTKTMNELEEILKTRLNTE
jgi:NTP pyrophosphatase (non-canonical NTP hydrolase)